MQAPEQSFCFYRSPLGLLQLKAEGPYITAVTFVDKEDAIAYAAPPVHAVLQQCIHELEEYFTGSRRHFEVPVRQPGTAFQQQVWQGLLSIPYGRTLSYLQFAKQLGNPLAIRAVGTTNGRNAIALLVPCHRVIGSNRSLTGYAGGIWRKQWLLDHENKYANGVTALF